MYQNMLSTQTRELDSIVSKVTMPETEEKCGGDRKENIQNAKILSWRSAYRLPSLILDSTITWVLHSTFLQRRALVISVDLNWHIAARV